jgi:hypothetical protein
VRSSSPIQHLQREALVKDDAVLEVASRMARVVERRADIETAMTAPTVASPVASSTVDVVIGCLRSSSVRVDHRMALAQRKRITVGDAQEPFRRS